MRLSDRVFDDCCDFCVRVDDTKREVDVCTNMTARCKGDTCATCRPCKRFIAAVGFTDALKLARTRPRPENVLTGRKLTQGAFR